jgi:hypothetical protein
VLLLGLPASGDTGVPDRRASSSCIAGGRAGQAQDHLYGFEVRETASYRFELSPTFWGVVQVQQKHPDKPWHFGIGCAAAHEGQTAILSIPLEPGFYWVVVDGYSWDQSGSYKLRADRDTSDRAVLRPEQADKVAPLCANAPPLHLGERAFGTFASTPGGARASCGLTGGNTVHRLSLATPLRVKLRAAGHFPPAIEIRSACHGPSEACARAPDGEHDVEIVQDLGAGEHFVVLDATRIAPREMYGPTMEGAGVMGAYIIDVQEVPR